MRYYRDILHDLCAVDMQPNKMAECMHSGELDNIYDNLMQKRNDLTKARSVLAACADFDAAVFDRALANINVQMGHIVTFYETSSMQNAFFGAAEVYSNPSIIIVLGCSAPLIYKRVEGALDYIKSYPDACIVVSGGGFGAQKSEAEMMAEHIKHAQVHSSVVIEDMSMDTLGNALFSKMLLKQKGILNADSRIMVITSRFHALRALRYFEGIYNNAGNDFQVPVAMHGVRTLTDDLDTVIAHEILSQHTERTQLGLFDSSKHSALDDQDMLIELFLKHTLYRNRYDILRCFLNT